MKIYSAKDVDAYIAKAPKQAREKLTEMRTVMLGSVSNIQEQISWGIPFYRYRGLLGGFATYTKHVSFGSCDVIPSDIRAALEKKGYATGKKTVKIGFDQEVPAGLITRILKLQAKENMGR